MQSEDSQRWDQIEALFDAALDQAPEQREAYVWEQCPNDPGLAERVIRLLQAEQRAAEFLETAPGETKEAAQAPGELQQTRIGPWEIDSLLGRGGMGEVYRAHRADGLYQQTVALKILRTYDQRQIKRFESERNILAELDHPNIARLIDGGLLDDGRPFMAMEFVDGLGLPEYLNKQQPGIVQRLQIFLSICDAVSYAHSNLVVHRDIKPDNIIIDGQGRARLLDFGIAKLTPEGLDVSETQAVATPNYAAPEQLCGGSITTRTDVYGLGATLYFMLCGQPPLRLESASLPQILDRVRHQQPTAPSQNSEALQSYRDRADLDAICLHAMAKLASERYSSVEQLREDINAHLSLRPIAARPPDWRDRLRRYLRRHRLPAIAATAISLSLILGIAISSWQARIASVERDKARRDAERLATMQSSILRLFKSAASDSDADTLTARQLFNRSAEHIGSDFADDPVTAARLMQMLGELLLSTEDFAAARKLLESAHKLMHHPEMPESVKASIYIDLAHLAYRDGDVPRARQEYAKARALWQDDPASFGAERIWGATLASQLARSEGETAAAVKHMQEAAEAARDYWGATHQETGIVLINLAVAHYYNNDLKLALRSCEQAWEVWTALQQTDSPDALNLLGNWGLFALRQGDPVTGEQRLAEALDLRSKLYGPSAALATLMKNLGIAHRLNGRLNAGMRLLEQAEWMAKKYAGEGSRLHASAVTALAQALVEDGQEVEARRLLREGLAASDGKTFSWHFVNQARLAALQDEAGEDQSAEQLFASSLDGLDELGQGALSLKADALRLRASHAALSGQWPQAQQWLEQALSAKQAARHADHYEVWWLQLELAQALAQQQQLAEAQKIWQDIRERSQRVLGAEHHISQLIAQAQL